MKTLHIQFFGKLKDHWHPAKQTIKTQAFDIEEVYQQLLTSSSSEPFKPSIKVALNDEFCEWSTEVNDGDSIAFLPPASGG